MNNAGGRWNCLWTLTLRLTGRQGRCVVLYGQAGGGILKEESSYSSPRAGSSLDTPSLATFQPQFESSERIKTPSLITHMSHVDFGCPSNYPHGIFAQFWFRGPP